MSDVIIIGAGIAGLSSAYYLQKQGHRVRILDKDAIIGNCSYGNAGMIVPSHFIPLATPGMVQQGIRWMFNSKSPFYVRPSLNRNLMDWGLKFLKHANNQHVARAAGPLRDLSLLSKKLFSDLAGEAGFEFGLGNKGILAFYKTEKAAEEEAHQVKAAIELGLDMAILNAEECNALQPQLNLDVLGAAHYRCDGHIYPPALMNALISHLEAKGVGIFRNHEVTDVLKEGHKITGVMANGLKWEADQYVLAAGAWSPALAKMTGLKVSIMPGKGYSFMEEEPAQRMTIPALLCEARVAITPMNGQIRYGGTMELDKINTRINRKRVQGIIESVPKYLTDLKPELPGNEKIWYGFRPSSPDGLPYIGRSGKMDNFIIATGHGMMGLSLGPATGLLVSQLLSAQQTEISVAAFSPSRFS